MDGRVPVGFVPFGSASLHYTYRGLNPNTVTYNYLHKELNTT